MENKDPIRKAIDYWLKSAEHDLKAVHSLFKSKNYAWCLFLGHLVLEKTLKALWVKTNQDIVVPRIHNLVKLAEMCRIKLNEEEKKNSLELQILISRAGILKNRRSSIKNVRAYMPPSI